MSFTNKLRAFFTRKGDDKVYPAEMVKQNNSQEKLKSQRPTFPNCQGKSSCKTKKPAK